MADDSNIHDGHRKRLKAHMLSEGFSGFDEVNLLEALLFYAVPRGDTNPLAHQLLGRFGSIVGVLNASKDELCSIAGIKDNASLLIKLVAQLTKIYWTDQVNCKAPTVLDSVKKIAEFMMPQFIGTNSEELFLICTDTNLKLLSLDLLMRGSVNRVNLDCRQIIELALKYNATGVILSHNHPGASANPSNEDIMATTHLKKALIAINIELIDHIVIADKKYTSMRQMRFI